MDLQKIVITIVISVMPTLASAAPHIEENAMIREPVSESMAIVFGSVVNDLGWPCNSISFAAKHVLYDHVALQCDDGKYTYELDQKPAGFSIDLREKFKSE